MNTIFSLETFLNTKEEVFHVARVTIHSRKDIQEHSHHFAEVFLIEHGSGWHFINDKKIKISKGTLCMIRPSDRHSFESQPVHEGLVITNIAFNADLLNFYENRYFTGEKTFFWSNTLLPFCTELPDNLFINIKESISKLVSQPRNQLNLDYFILHLFLLFENNTTENNMINIPLWLYKAIKNYNTPQHFKQGIKGFLNITHKSLHHTNRNLKIFTNKTLTETIIEAKLKYAGQQLIMTEESIKSIANDCGFMNIGNFYIQFAKYYNISPKKYRTINKLIV